MARSSWFPVCLLLHDPGHRSRTHTCSLPFPCTTLDTFTDSSDEEDEGADPGVKQKTLVEVRPPGCMGCVGGLRVPRVKSVGLARIYVSRTCVARFIFVI